MLNRAIFSQKINQSTTREDSKSKKYQIKTNMLNNNKIMIRKCMSNQSTLRSPKAQTKKQDIASLIKVIPNQVYFKQVQQHQLYQMSLHIRNDTNQLQKIRIIQPIKKQFKIKYGQNFTNQIACGLAIKIQVLFCSDDFYQRVEDKIIVMGNQFRIQIPLIAQSSKSDFQIPKIFNIGTMVFKHERKIQIPVKNKGTKAGVIAIEDIRSNQYCPNINYTNKSLTIVPGKSQIFQLFIKPVVMGQLEVKMKFSSMDTCIIKALVVQNQVQLFDQSGSKMTFKDFGQLMIGQKVQSNFFIANTTQNKISCILQSFNKKKQQADIKIDNKRNIFISESSPQEYSAMIKAGCFSLQKNNLDVNPFQSVKNSIIIQKVPQKEEIDLFVQNLTRNISTTVYKITHPGVLNNRSKLITNTQQTEHNLFTGRSNNTKSKLIQSNSVSININSKDKIINQTLAIKFSNQDKILKIPVKFIAKIPNLQINKNYFQFNPIFIKQVQQKQFILKNQSNKRIKLSFQDTTNLFKQNFKIEGPEFIEKNSEQKYSIKFRPLIKKKFAQTLVIKVFDHFPIEIKVFGQCLGLDVTNINLKHQMSLTMTDRNRNLMDKSLNWKSLLKDKSARQQTEEAMNFSLGKDNKLKALISENNSVVLKNDALMKNKKNQLLQNIRKRKNQVCNDDQQTAQIVSSLSHNNMVNYKQQKQELFFKKEQFMKSATKKKPFNHPSNLRQILRYENLSLEELQKVKVQQKTISFGHIFIGSKTSKKFKLVNDLPNPILFELDTQGYQALQYNNQEAVRIQGYATYQIDIFLHPTDLGQLQMPLTYIINKKHIFELKISAIVTLVNLQLSCRSFVFNFNDDQGVFQKEQILKVYNNGNKKTKFYFQQPQNRSFKLSTLQGELQPKSFIELKIIYSPFNGQQSGQQRVDVQKLKMKVHQGAENVIKCTGTVKQPKISIKETQFNCDTCLISVPITNKITIKNLSKIQTYIKVQFQPSQSCKKITKQQIQSYFNIQSSVYQLNSQQKKQIIFNFLCHQVKKIQLNIVVSIRGYKVTKIPFTANMIFPQILTQTAKINFDNVPIMSNYCMEMISLINTTPTQIKLQLDNNYPKDEYFIEILAVKDKNLQINYEDQKNKTFLNSFLAMFKDNRRLSKRRSIICNKILTLPPNGEQSVFNVRFIPKNIKKYEFQLPLKIYGSVQKVIRPVNLMIKCNAIDPVVYVQPQALKFDTKIISEAKSSYSQSITISNPHDYIVKFKIQSLSKNCQAIQNNKKAAFSGNSSLIVPQKLKKQFIPVTNTAISNNQSIFTFSQYDGQIQPNSKIQIFVSFKPGSEGQFLQKFNIFLGPKSQQSKSQSLSSYILDISGSAISPTLKFNCNQAIMPVVPLNMQSRIFVMIQNHGYDAITICKWKTSNHFPHIQIKVNFVQGKLLSLAKKSLRIQVIFSSLAPISFTTMLQFYDEYGNKYELPLSCTAQNSIFTSYPYIQSDNQYTIIFNNQQKIIKILATGKNSFYEQNKQISGIHTMSCAFINKWINFQLNMNLKSFPQSIIESQGKQFVKFINRISAKNLIKKNQFVHQSPIEKDYENISGDDVGLGQMNMFGINNLKGKIQKILNLVELYSQTIKKLKIQGAFLNQIRPQFLLNYSQYVNYQNHKRLLICSQSVFQVISIQCWMALFYQLCKIYIQPQITQKILTKLKIQGHGIFATNSTISSNLYSTIQISLLKFANYYLCYDDHSSTSSSSQNHIINFTQQTKIFEVIQKILQSNFHLSLTEQINSLKNSASIMSPHVFLTSISKFLHSQLKQFGLSAYLSSIDLFNMGVKQFVLYMINLLQMIYHYSNPNYIKFQGAVGDKITKVIEIQNPTNKKINYFVKIIPNQVVNQKQNSKPNKAQLQQNRSLLNNPSSLSQNFSNSLFIPQRNQVIIEPKQKAELKVVYHCKNAKGQAANLYLIPTKQDDDFTIPQPLLFKLTTTILSKIVMKKINLNATLYEVLPIHLDVQLPSQIPESAQFSLSLFQESPINQTQKTGFINPPSFFFNQSHVRTLKQGNKDSVQLKLVPLSLGQKNCKISYYSSVFGQFIYEISVKVANPKVLKQFKIKDLKVNTEEQVFIAITKQNQLLNSLIKVYYPQLYQYHNKTEKNIGQPGTKRNITSTTKLNMSILQKASAKDLKYEIQINDNPYVSLAKGNSSIDKMDPKQNKIGMKVFFTKPFKEYTCTMTVKNQFLKDIRIYKIAFIVTSPPKIVKMHFKTSARQSISQKLPLKIAPCDLVLKSNCECFSIQNISKEYFVNTDLICHFRPEWIMQKQAVIDIQNKQTLEQIIYQISLKAEQPQKFQTYELIGSSLFNEQVSIPIDVNAIFVSCQEQNNRQSTNGNPSALSNINYAQKKNVHFQVKRLFKRSHTIQSQQFYPFVTTKTPKSNTGLYIRPPTMNNPSIISLTKQKQPAPTDRSEKQKSQKQKSKTLKAKNSEQKITKNINMTLHSSPIDNETGSIRLFKPNSQEYYWAKVIIKNRSVKQLKQITMQQKINHFKIQYLDEISNGDDLIDWDAPDFELKFQKQSQSLIFKFIQESEQNLLSGNNITASTQTTTKPLKPTIKSSFLSPKSTIIRPKRPALIFNPFKQIQSTNTLYFRSNNKQYMISISIKAQPLPTIIVPEISTFNTEPKQTYLNLINGSNSAGVYKVVILNVQDPMKRCFKLQDENLVKYSNQQHEDSIMMNTSIQTSNTHQNNSNKTMPTYYLKPKQKRQIKIHFRPQHINQRQKFVIRFQSQTLPNYTYILNGRSQFKIQQQSKEFQIYQDNLKPFFINFSNLFQRKEYFTIQLEEFPENQYQFSHPKIQETIQIHDPVNKKFNLEQGQNKTVFISVKQSYFSYQRKRTGQQEDQDQSKDPSVLKCTINVKIGEKVIKKYYLSLLIIKNLFFSLKRQSSGGKDKFQEFKEKSHNLTQVQKYEMKNNQKKQKNSFTWFCKARQTIYQTIQIPSQHNMVVKEIKCPPQVQKYLTFTCIMQDQQSATQLIKKTGNHLKIKYSPLKPLKKKIYDLILIGDKGEKFRIQCEIFVDEPPIDDTIVIKTSQINQIGCVSFKLTNTTKSSAKYRAHFVKKLPEFSLQSDHGVLDGYGKPGTQIMIKFKSHINNRRLEQKLIIQTEDMYWCFKVKGMLSKDTHV